MFDRCSNCLSDRTKQLAAAAAAAVVVAAAAADVDVVAVVLDEKFYAARLDARF